MLDHVPAAALAVAAGVALGALYFEGLRWTTRRAAHRTAPAAFLLASLLLRLGLLAAGLVWIGGGDPLRTALCGLGVLSWRWLFVRPPTSPRVEEAR